MNLLNKCAFFDFDGTITTKDTLPDFIEYVVGKPKYYLGLIMLSPILVAFKLRVIPNYLAKEKLISHYFKGYELSLFQEIADRYSLEQIDSIVRLQAIEKIKWHKEQGHKVVIVSASMECWLKGWCKNHNIELIATQLEVIDGRLTGKFATKNCNGAEKVSRVREAYDLTLYSHIYAYGDSRGDKELLALADESFYKPFRRL